MNENVLESNYTDTLGRGKVLVKKDSENNWLDLCSVESFNVTVTTETLDKISLRSGIKRIQKSVTVSQNIEGNFVISDTNIENLKLFFMAGDEVDASQTTGTLVAEEVTVNYNRWTKISKENLDAVVTVKDKATGLITYVENTDYILDRKAGLIAPIEGGDITDNEELTIDCDYAARTITRISGGAVTSQKRHLWFVGDPAEGVIQHYKCYANIFPSGDLAAIGDEWQQFTCNFKTEVHSAYPNGYIEYEDHGKR
ncbi:hypothetical protein DRH14_03965 [Candidatus Shapirobacteria bacterium]|nr:MAG: hypothetical protein DRH14_03965 [Candidatus Shapirobacteria bacterium]